MKNFIMLTALDGRKIGIAVSLIKYWVADGCVTRVYFEDYHPKATNFGCFKESVEEIAEKIEKATEAISENSMGEFAEATSNEVVKKDTKVSKTLQLDNDAFVLIDAEGLSMNDEFMQYKPKGKREEDTKKLISEAIEKKVKNFYRPKYDPSFTVEHCIKYGPYFSKNRIQFVAGAKPAVGKSYNWWADIAMEYTTDYNSRIGTRLQYGAFLGVLIKKLVEEGKSVEWAWNAVCNITNESGRYMNSQYLIDYKPTGLSGICGFYDIFNTGKILADDEEKGFWIAGSHYDTEGCWIERPIASLKHHFMGDGFNAGAVGWYVFS